MPTGGKTNPILVDEGLASYLKELKISTQIPVWKLVQDGLDPQFIKKYNHWVKTDPASKNYKEINNNDW